MDKSLFHQVMQHADLGYAYHRLIRDKNGAPVDYQFLEINPAFERFTGLKSENIINHTVTEIIPKILDEKFKWIQVYGSLVDNGEELEFEQFSYALDRFYSVKAFATDKDHFVTLFFDISDKKTQERLHEENESKYKTYIDNAPYAIFEFNAYGRILDINEEAAIMTGYMRDELLKMNMLRLFQKKDRRDIFKDFTSLEVQENVFLRYDYVRKGSEIRHGNSRTVKINDNRFVSFAIDETERRIKENKLDDINRRYQSLFHNLASGCGIYHVQSDGKYARDYTVIDLNEAGLAMEGKNREEAIGKSLDFFRPKLDDFGLVDVLRNVWLTGESAIHGPKEYIDDVFDNFYENKIFKIGEREIVSLYTDVTELKKAQIRLESQATKLQAYFSQAPVGVFILNAEGQFMDANQKALDMTGYTLDEIKQLTFSDISAAENTPEALGTFDRLKVNGFAYIEKNYVTKNGEIRTWSMRDVKIDDNTYFGFGIDITDQVKAETKLIESEERFKLLFEDAPLAYQSLNIDGDFITVNNAWLEMLGFDKNDVVGNPFKKFISPDYFDRYESNFPEFKRHGTISTFLDLVNKNNEIIHVRIDGRISYDNNGNFKQTHCILQNMTEQMQLQKEKEAAEALLRNQQKLESIGTLASGVAHEINNPINGIMNYSQLLLDSEDKEEAVKNFAPEILLESERVANIVKNLLSFSRQNKEDYQYASVDSIITRTLSLINTIFRHDHIRLDINIQKDIPDVPCRSQQIQQVIMNLLTNARDALNIKYSGLDDNKRIEIKVNQTLQEQKPYVQFQIKDYGSGIQTDYLDNIFDPFFTTKDRDKGTGLGLSISYGIIKDHGGMIDFDTKPGEWTVFNVYLPVDKTN